MCTPILTRHWFRLLVWGASTPQHSQMCEDGPPCKVSEKAFGPQCWKLKVRPLWLKCQSQGNTGRVEFLILAPNLFLLHEVNEWTLTTLLLDTKLTQTYSAPSLHSHTHTHTHNSPYSQHMATIFLLSQIEFEYAVSQLDDDSSTRSGDNLSIELQRSHSLSALVIIK